LGRPAAISLLNSSRDICELPTAVSLKPFPGSFWATLPTSALGTVWEDEEGGGCRARADSLYGPLTLTLLLLLLLMLLLLPKTACDSS
jgi:hypothetical protein